MRTLLNTLAAAALLVATNTGAQTDITRNYSFDSGDGVPVGYVTLGGTTAGTFQVSTAMNSDPSIYLFQGPPDMLGNALAYKDDYNGLNSFFSTFLSVGTYTVALGRYPFYESEARDGFMDARDVLSGTLSLRSDDGVAVAAADIATIPEPGT